MGTWRAALALLVLTGLAAPVRGQHFNAPSDFTNVAEDTAAPAPDHTVEREAYVMGTRLIVRVNAPGASGREAAEAALSAARAEEDRLSTWRSDTELAALNGRAGEPVAVSRTLLETLVEVGEWVAVTGGAFDPTVGALVDAWDLRGEGRVPSIEALASARARTGWTSVRLDPGAGTVRLGSGQWLDSGGFGKGLALRRAGAALAERGGEGVLDFGGQLLVTGGVSEPVWVAHPADRDRPVAGLRVSGVSVATTGASERWVEVDGRRLGHVLDPRTGQPVPPWGSVTVVAGDPFDADVLSTALFVMGPDAALEWARERSYGVLVLEDGSDGLRARWNRAMERWLVTVPAASAGAPPAPASQDTTELERLKRQVEAITRELEVLRLGGDVVEQADTSILGFGPAASKVYRVNQGVSIGGYGEVLYRWRSDELEDGTSSPATDVWDALRAIVYFGYKFNDRLLFNSEIEIEHGDEAFLEFAYLDYRLSDAIGLRGGLLLAPMGLVNELHEPPVFLGTTRPLVEQRVIPSTWRENGLGVFGDLGPFTYRAYVMNGLDASGFSAAGLRGGRQKGSTALAEDVGGVARVDYAGVPGLLVGGSVYHGGADHDQFAEDVTMTIWEGHVSYQARGLDLRALLAGAHLGGVENLSVELGLSGEDVVAERLSGGYAHAGYDILRWLRTSQQLLPYVRYEWLNTQAEVPSAPGFAADPANETTAVLIGAAWKPVPAVAVKADYQIHGNEAETGRNEFALVLSYLF